jgi:hypothetical protein
VPLAKASIEPRVVQSASNDQATKTDNYTEETTHEDATASFTRYAQQIASGLYPTLATQINKGVTTKTLLDPYAQVAASVLGYGTDSNYEEGASASASEVSNAEGALGITWSSPKWNVALQGGKAATGKANAPMTLDAWRQHVITTPNYGWSSTSAAKNLMMTAGNKILEDMGFIKQ